MNGGGKVKKLISFIACFLLITATFGGLFADADGISIGGISIGGSDNTPVNGASDDENAHPVEKHDTLPYTKTELSDDFKDFLVTVNGNITLTLIGNETDYAGGHYNEYYHDLFSDGNSCYEQVINLLKTVSESNRAITFTTVDPFDLGSHGFMNTYADYQPTYGDLIVTVSTDFDGNARTRTAIIKGTEYFTYQSDGNGLMKIDGVILETVLLEKLKELRTSRDINVALLKGINPYGVMDYLRNYTQPDGYRMENINLEDERLNGFDMIIIASPVRDITLEELVILDGFMATGNKSVMFFPPKASASLPIFSSFLAKWGISMMADKYLCTREEGGYFDAPTQLYGTPNDKKHQGTDSFYIMNFCTPITYNGISGVTTRTLMKTSSKKVGITDKNPDEAIKNIADTDEGKNSAAAVDEANFTYKSMPLISMSDKEYKNGPSRLVVFASCDFISTYFALGNEKTDDGGYVGNKSGNLAYTEAIMNGVSDFHRGETSGLAEYAVGLAELGFDTTTGLSVQYIKTVAITVNAIFIIAIVTVLIVFNRRKKYAEK